MELKRLFLEQLEREGVASRKAIERVPEGQNGWKPHEKSMELGSLAALVATMPGWVALMIEHDELDLDGKGRSFRTVPAESRAELVAMLDKALADSRKSAGGHDGGASDEAVAVEDGGTGAVRGAEIRDDRGWCAEPPGSSSRAAYGVSAVE